MKRRRTKRAFALIIVVALLALLIMVLVSLATLTRIEAGIGANSLKQAQARQNARFALHLAIGELQRSAGPDECATARAQIEGSAVHPYWTGVWRGGSIRNWLVSANENRPVGSPDAIPSLPVTGFATSMSVDTAVTIGGVPAITLVGPRTAGTASVAGYVAAPRIGLTGDAPDGTADAVLGGYAWWVGDEGIKARINHIDPFASSPPDSLEGRARLSLPQRAAPEAMNGFSGIPPNAPEIARVLSNSQLSFLPVGNPGVAEVRNRFHDLSMHAAGVLSNSAGGGLRKDLSAYFASGDAASLDAAPTSFSTRSVAAGVTMAYARSWSELGSAGSGLTSAIVPREFSASMQQHGVHPVIVRHSHFFGVSYEGVQLRVHYMPVFALWNPYDSGIASADYVIEVAIPFEFQFAGTGVTGLQPSAGALWFIARNVDFRPGECRLLSLSPVVPWRAYEAPGPTVSNELAPGWRSSCSVYFGFGTGTVSPTPPSDVQLIQTGPATAGSVRLRLGQSTTSPVLQEVAGASAFPAYATQARPAAVIAESTAVAPPTLLFYDEMVAHGWSIVPSSGDNWVNLGHTADSTGTWIQEELASSRGRAYTGYSWLRPGSIGDPDAGQPINAFWHVPRGSDVPLLSLGEFQNIQLVSTTWRPRYLFDPDSGTTTSTGFWDDYFFSGLAPTLTQANIEDPRYQPAFSRLRFLRRDGVVPSRKDLVYDASSGFSKPVDTAAANLLVEGTFNVNSTSVEAWRAVLEGLSGISVAWGQSSNVDVEAGHAFVRSCFPGAGSLTATDLQNSANAWAGFRRLSDGQINALADYFAQNVPDAFPGIKAAGTPFQSVSDFINSTLIEDAIAAAGVNSPGWTGVGGAPGGATIPGVFTKWDLISRLLPIVGVRSDTFVIRAYGDVVNPALDPDGAGVQTGPMIARAWCEAVVQRIPDYVNSNPDEPTLDPWEIPGPGTQNQRFGRRFVITSFRWLSPDDI